LSPNKMLNDQAISAYLRLIERRSFLQPHLCRVWAFDTFWYLAFKQGGFNRVKAWNRNKNPLERDIILFPIHMPEENHWTLVVAWPRRREIQGVDALGRSRLSLTQDILSYLGSVAREWQLPFRKEEWTLLGRVSCTRQPPGSIDCGVYLCYYAENLCLDKPINGTPIQPIEYRKKMASTLRRSTVLGRTDFTGTEHETHQSGVGTEEPPLLAPPVPKFNPDYRFSSGTYDVEGKELKVWTAWDPLFEALMEASVEGYNEYHSAITFPPKPTATPVVLQETNGVEMVEAEENKQPLSPCLTLMADEDDIKQLDPHDGPEMEEPPVEPTSTSEKQRPELSQTEPGRRYRAKRKRVFLPDGTFVRVDVRKLSKPSTAG
jgi:hypothetical protein